MHIEEGRRLGKYRIIRTLGQGGEGSVYLAEDESLSRYVAVKSLWGQEARGGRKAEKMPDGRSGEDGERIREEAVFLRDLRHSMLPVVYELLYEEGWYLVMEYVEGTSLHNYIQKTGPVSEEQARLWAASLADVLDYLHTRKTPVIYRDLKPDNIMVCRDGSLKLVDFGAAGLRSFGEETGTRMAFSAGFAAPEQRGEDGRGVRADERSDIYALGKTLYYMVTGAVPGYAPGMAFPASCHNPLLSEGLEEIISHCTEEAPKARYQAAVEVMRDLCRMGAQRKEGEGQCARGRRVRRRAFVRHVEKQVCLTEFFPI